MTGVEELLPFCKASSIHLISFQARSVFSWNDSSSSLSCLAADTSALENALAREKKGGKEGGRVRVRKGGREGGRERGEGGGTEGESECEKVRGEWQV